MKVKSIKRFIRYFKKDNSRFKIILRITIFIFVWICIIRGIWMFIFYDIPNITDFFIGIFK